MNYILKVLITDSNKEFANIIKKIIEKNTCFKVIGLISDHNIEKEIINTYKPDLVVTNIKKDYTHTIFDTIEQIYNKGYMPTFLIISSDISYYMDMMIKYRIKYYLNKPFNIGEFISMLDVIYNNLKFRNQI